MKPPRLFPAPAWPLALMLLLLFSGSALAAQNGAWHVDREHGYRFRLPSNDWRILQEGEQGGAHTLIAQNPAAGGMWVVVQAAAPTEGDLDSVSRARQALQSRSLGQETVLHEITTIEREGSAGRRIEIEYGKPAFLLVEEIFFHGEQFVILQARYRKGDPVTSRAIETLYASFSWDLPGNETGEEAEPDAAAAEPPPPPIPVPPLPDLRIEPGPEGRIVVIRRRGDFATDARSFALSLPAALVAGRPVCLLVGERLTSAQIDLFNRLPVREIVSVGPPPAELRPFVTRQVAEALEIAAGDTAEPAAPHEAVVASSDLADLLEAAPLAVARRLPLLAADALLDQRLARRGITRVFTVASRQPVALPDDVDEEDLSDPEVRWDDVLTRSGAESAYLALANIGAHRSRESGAILGAVLLAATHRGMLQVLDEEVTFHYAELAPAEQVPDGMASEGAVLRGTFDLSGTHLDVAVPSLGPLAGLSQVDKYGDMRLDLDADGRFDPAGEVVEAGSVRKVDGRAYSFSLRLIGAVGVTKFTDAMQTHRAVALEPPAEQIAEGLFGWLEGMTLPRYLLLAGDHRELPFDYVKDPVYAESTMHEQELCTDNIYADPDGDRYLDIAVGRFVASDPVTATATASRSAVHSMLRGKWRSRATLIYPCWPDDEMKLLMPIVFASFEALMRGVESDLRSLGFDVRSHLRERGDLPEVYPHLSGNSLLLFAHHAGPTTWLFRMQGHDPDEMRMLVSARSKSAAKLGPGWGVVPPLDGAPIVISAGCDSAGLDYEVEPAEALVHSFFERGAVAYLGNTRAGFPDTEEHLIRFTIQRTLGLGTPGGKPQSLGEAFRQGKNLLDFLITERGPFTSTPPFEHYDVAMRREWHSLVLYGDPALTMPRPDAPFAPPLEVELDRAAGPGRPFEITVRREAPLSSEPIWIMEQVGLGPLHEITNMTAPGLGYNSVPWGTYHESFDRAKVPPGLFLDLPLPDDWPQDVTLEPLAGPDWVVGPHRLVDDARGRRHLLLAIDMVRYAMSLPDQAEDTDRVVIRVSPEGR